MASSSSQSQSVPALHIGDTDDELEATARSLEQIVPDADPEIVRLILQACGNDADAALTQILDSRPASNPEEDTARVRKSAEEVALHLEKIIPDCDPGHLRKILSEVNNNSNAALERVLGGEEPYPKRAARAVAVRNIEKPKGEEYWFDSKARKALKLSEAYRKESLQMFLDEFPQFGVSGLTRMAEKHGFAYALAWKDCYSVVSSSMLNSEKKRWGHLVLLRCPRVAKGAGRAVKSSILRDEVAFVKQWRQQQQEELGKQAAREAYLEECEQTGQLLVCECCCSEGPPDETVQCAAGHLFCCGCVRRYVETQLSGEMGMPKLSCMSTQECCEVLPPSEIRRVLPKTFVDRYDEAVKKASIEKFLLQGDITGLERCPFCDFAMDMELSPEENKIFVCHNEACGKESCRLCKQESHIPLKCSEVKEDKQSKYRLTVEESMSNALIRECPSCKAKGVVSRFVKTDGCNKMACPKCKGSVCYICAEEIPVKVGYGHFCQHVRDPKRPGCPHNCKKCNLWDAKDALTVAESKRVQEAGLQASDAYIREHGGEKLDRKLHVLHGDRVGKDKVKAAGSASIEQEPLRKRLRVRLL
eukprot:TRINITY_DN67728_c0_g1_i1.p1 TRINITY_DN67728_c0_g1~~TRINITY_DN67728_c0_g1_i1.p1  ORF type:complete len:589 (-),score=99.04 TRINITY_DN67728_c0_g1_i1:191-1957(-)